MTLKLVEGQGTPDEGGSRPTQSREPIPSGTYAATVLAVEERDSRFKVDRDDPNSPYEREVNFKFRIEEDPYSNRFVWGSTPTTFSTNEKCKLRYWVEEIFGFEPLESGFEMELEDLVNQPVNVVVDLQTYPDKATGVMKSTSRVVNVIRITDGGAEESTYEAF